MNYLDYLTTPIGQMEIQASPRGITQVNFVESACQPVNPNKITRLCEKQLTEYFHGERTTFELPLDLQGTDFQKTIWSRLLKIPFGAISSYRDIAKAIQKPNAARAVGTANGKNPVSIIVPCHRVIASNGNLAGYAGGMKRKAWLLVHENGVLK